VEVVTVGANGQVQTVVATREPNKGSNPSDQLINPPFLRRPDRGRLQQIKRRYDPTDYFRHKLSVEPA
jgi:berberine-like enzyme